MRKHTGLRKHVVGTVLILLGFAPLAAAEPMHHSRSLLGDLWTEIATAVADAADDLVTWASASDGADQSDTPASSAEESTDDPSDPQGIQGFIVTGG